MELRTIFFSRDSISVSNCLDQKKTGPSRLSFHKNIRCELASQLNTEVQNTLDKYEEEVTVPVYNDTVRNQEDFHRNTCS